MVPTETLQKNVQDGLDWVLRQAGVEEAEIFASVQNLLLARLNYTSHIPCHGVEEPKSVETLGVGVHVVFREGGDPVHGKGAMGTRRVGFGSQAGELSLNGIQRAFE